MIAAEEKEKDVFEAAANDNAAAVALYCQFLEKSVKLKGVNGLTVAIFAVRNFVHICEVYGEAEGRHINRVIEEKLNELLAENELYAPYEIHKFAVILQGCAEDNAARLKSVFDEIIQILANGKCHITASISCGLCACDGSSITDIIKQADMARHSQEEKGVGGIVTYSDSIRLQAERKRLIEQDLSSAVRKGQLTIDIQPKYDLKTGKCISAEALVRWEHPALGRVMPDEFISISEQTGDVIDIDMFVLETVCKNLRRWLDSGIKPVPIAVNQSRMHIADPNYAESVFRMMEKYDVWPSMIELETTESVIINDYEKIAAVLEKLRSYGFILSVDDFGSGFTSLDMISELEYDVIKLDQKLISKITTHPRTLSLVKHIIAMSHDMGMQVVAEGVETAEQAEILKKVDCDIAQGFYYSYPVSVESFDAKIFGIVT